MTHMPSRAQVLFCLSIVFFEELDNADVVLKSDNVGPREGFESWHVRSRGGQGEQNVFGEADGVEFEVGFE